MSQKFFKVRRGFTLVELLVVIGIIAVLIGILLPTLNKARIMAKDVTCAARLHQLSLALNMYLITNKMYPAPYMQGGAGSAQAGTTAVNYWPYNFTQSYVNGLNPYLGVKTMATLNTNHTLSPDSAYLPGTLAAVNAVSGGGSPLAATDVNFLSQIYFCPEAYDYWTGTVTAANVANAVGPRCGISNAFLDGGCFYYGGYMYWAGCKPTDRWFAGPGSATQYATGSTLTTPHPEDISSATGKKRGVILADSLFAQFNNGIHNWYFVHGRNGPSLNGNGSDAPTAVRGQHSAYTDGSVIFVKPTTTNGVVLSNDKNNPAVNQGSTMYYTGNTQTFYWATLDRFTH